MSWDEAMQRSDNGKPAFEYVTGLPGNYLHAFMPAHKTITIKSEIFFVALCEILFELCVKFGMLS